MEKSAIISEDRRYRYTLSRLWDHEQSVIMFIMLNPSTLDAEQDNPTIRRCTNFAKAWGYGGLHITNLFAYRSKIPQDLLEVKDPVGVFNHNHIIELSKKCGACVCAWGNAPIIHKMQQRNKIIDLSEILIPCYCLGLTKYGTPKHPLYMKKNSVLSVYKL